MSSSTRRWVKAWEEWQVPRELPQRRPLRFPKPQRSGLTLRAFTPKWWQARRDRQAQIDASIARRAETETLYDQPYEDNKRVRVSGPFTVESLSPHRVLSPDDPSAGSGQGSTISEREARKGQDFAPGGFTGMILDNLKKAGVQNTRKAERLTFDRLDPYPGVWLHAAGEYTEADLPSPVARERRSAAMQRDCGTRASRSPSARSTARSARSR